MSGVLFVQDLAADANLAHAMVSAGLQIEGVMAKLKDSIYRAGVRSPNRVQIKRAGWDEGRKWNN